MSAKRWCWCRFDVVECAGCVRAEQDAVLAGTRNPGTIRTRIIDELTILKLRGLGPFEMVVDGDWVHYDYATDPEAADRQRSIVAEYERRNGRDMLIESVRTTDALEAATKEQATRFLAALPRDAALLDARVPLHFGPDGVFLVLDSKVHWLAKDGGWCTGSRPENWEVSALEGVIERLDARVTALLELPPSVAPPSPTRAVRRTKRKKKT